MDAHRSLETHRDEGAKAPGDPAAAPVPLGKKLVGAAQMAAGAALAAARRKRWERQTVTTAATGAHTRGDALHAELTHGRALQGAQAERAERCN